MSCLRMDDQLQLFFLAKTRAALSPLQQFLALFNISGVQQTRFHTRLKFSQISKRDLSPPRRSADKWPRFSFVVFGDYKSRQVIVRQLHCIIMCLIRVRGSPSQHRTYSRCISACCSQQKKSAAKPFAPPLLSIRAPSLASPDAF